MVYILRFVARKSRVGCRKRGFAEVKGRRRYEVKPGTETRHIQGLQEYMRNAVTFRTWKAVEKKRR
jgi:hypothetical protein